MSVALLSQAKNMSVALLIQLQLHVISNDFHWLFGSQSKHIYFFVYPQTHKQTHKVTYGGSTLPKKALAEFFTPFVFLRVSISMIYQFIDMLWVGLEFKKVRKIVKNTVFLETCL